MQLTRGQVCIDRVKKQRITRKSRVFGHASKLPKLEVEFARDKCGADVGGGAALAVSAWRMSSHCVVLCVVVVLVFSSCSLIV